MYVILLSSSFFKESKEKRRNNDKRRKDWILVKKLKIHNLPFSIVENDIYSTLTKNVVSSIQKTTILI